MGLSPWKYKGSVISEIGDLPENAFGFVYVVRHKTTGKKYIGKKQLLSNRTLPPLKGQKRKRKVVKESDWKKYHGSSDVVKNLIKEGGYENFEREILEVAYSKMQLTYLETKYLFTHSVLEDESYINDNILGKFYRAKLV